FKQHSMNIFGGSFVTFAKFFMWWRKAQSLYYLFKSKLFGGMTIFSKIIIGEIPGYKIAENEKFYAFLDIFPLAEGHTLVVPKIEVDKFFDVPDDFLTELLIFAKPIAHAIEKAFDCNRCGISVIGLEVPHAHLHLVPINSADDLNFTRPKLKLSIEEFKKIQEKILSHL
ncbi:MAG: HIT family protein, partial [Sphingobacteriales bacterium]